MLLLKIFFGVGFRQWWTGSLDFTFADDILVFGISYHVLGTLLDKRVENLAALGQKLHVGKTKQMTSQTQPPPRLQTPGDWNTLSVSSFFLRSFYPHRVCGG